MAATCAAEAFVVRVADETDLALLADLPPERVAWTEVPLELAARRELDAFAVDVLLREPDVQAPRLYDLARHRHPHLPRLSIPARKGLREAAVVGMALGFPIRLVPVQPGPEALQELEDVLQRYLHDARAVAPVEPFHSALATLIHGDPSTLWELVEQEPGPPAPECHACRAGPFCQGWFKHPDPGYDCAGVLRLLDALEAIARQLQADLQEAGELVP